MVSVRMRGDRAVECCWEEGLWPPRVFLPAGTMKNQDVKLTTTDISQLKSYKSDHCPKEVLDCVVEKCISKFIVTT